VILNMSAESQYFEGVTGSIALSTDRAQEGTAVDGVHTVAPWTGVVISS
jgi:hypothetical protein